jgi:hypothetical protein
MPSQHERALLVSIEKLLADVARCAGADTAAAILHRGLTLDGRVEREAALAGLSPAERHACDCIVAKASEPSPSGNLSIAFRPHGRLHLLARGDFEAQATVLALLCHVELEAGDLETFHALRRSTEEALEQERAAICADLDKQGYERVCTELLAITEHMAPLICYVGDRCISNFYNVGKSGFAGETTLADAVRQVSERRAKADIAILTAIHCLHLIAASGPYTRLEELNAGQLSRSTVAAFFDGKRAFYETIDRHAADESFNFLSLREKAAWLAAMRVAIGTKQRFIRLINGSSLSKREAILSLPPTSAPGVDASIASRVMATLQRSLPAGCLADPLFNGRHFGDLLGPGLVPVEQRSHFGSGLEYLVDRVVAEAVQSTHSDIGMTRSARDYRRFAEALHHSETAVACGWTQAEYFCHVVASPDLSETLSPKTLCTTLSAISARMRFNSWHYVPSYFEATDVPASRGWFAAPRMADIADDSDQHHTGHMHAAVRYCIRSPLPLRVSSAVLPGFIDLRLMRQSGIPYGQAELLTAIAYTEVLQAIYQKLMDHVLGRDARFVFSFGDKKWFDRIYATPPGSPDVASTEIAMPPLAAPETHVAQV